MGPIVVSPTPPRTLSEKALIFLKCTHASKLSRENMGGDVIYSECSKLPLRKFSSDNLKNGVKIVSPQFYFLCISDATDLYKIFVIVWQCYIFHAWHATQHVCL